MAQRIYFEPLSELTPSRYEVFTVSGMDETWLAAFPNQIPGPYWLDATRRFTFEDPLGTDRTIYRVRALGPSGELYGDSGPFQPSAAVAASLQSRVRVDHNYLFTNNLQCVTRGGVGVPDVTLRVFRASDWDAGRRDAALYVTATGPNGLWKTSLWLEPGLEFVLLAEKPGSFGPDETRLTT